MDILLFIINSVPKEFLPNKKVPADIDQIDKWVVTAAESSDAGIIRLDYELGTKVNSVQYGNVPIWRADCLTNIK